MTPNLSEGGPRCCLLVLLHLGFWWHRLSTESMTSVASKSKKPDAWVLKTTKNLQFEDSTLTEHILRGFPK